jgi:hypothetical protein
MESEKFGFQHGNGLTLLISPHQLTHILTHTRIPSTLHLALYKRFEFWGQCNIHRVHNENIGLGISILYWIGKDCQSAQTPAASVQEEQGE